MTRGRSFSAPAPRLCPGGGRPLRLLACAAGRRRERELSLSPHRRVWRGARHAATGVAGGPRRPSGGCGPSPASSPAPAPPRRPLARPRPVGAASLLGAREADRPGRSLSAREARADRAAAARAARNGAGDRRRALDHAAAVARPGSARTAPGGAARAWSADGRSRGDEAVKPMHWS